MNPLRALSIVGLLLVALLLACRSAPQATDPELEALREQIRPLQAEIEAWRELRFLEPVEVQLGRSSDAGVAGWYDPAVDRLFVDTARPEAFQRGVLLHELVHALQDQHFDLVSVHERAGDGEEAQLAVSALIEGEAMLAVVELLDYDFESHAHAAGPGPHDPMIERSLFVYGDGLRYVRAVRSAEGWAGVSQRFAAPPRTRAQILEPGASP